MKLKERVHKKKFLNFYVFAYIFFLASFIFANELNLQVGVEKWDKSFALKDGYYEASLIKRKNVFQIKQTRLKIWKQNYNLLIVGFNEEGEEKWKLLYNSKTNQAYFSRMPSYKIILISSYSEVESIPEFDFSFADLLFFKIEERFIPKNLSEYQAKSKIYYKIELSPLLELQYQKIFIYLSKENQSPHRMDVYNLSGEFYKIIRIQPNEENKNLYFKKIILTNTNTSEENILEFLNYKVLNIPDFLFDLSNFTQTHFEVYP